MTAPTSPGVVPADVREHVMPIMTLGYNARQEISDMRRAGVRSIVIAVPWPIMAPHEAQAQRNHSQSLARLAERGGLSACEAVAILENRAHHRMTMAAANERLHVIVQERRALADRSEPRQEKEGDRG